MHPEALLRSIIACLVAALVTLSTLPARAADEPDLIFKRSTVFKWLTPNDKLATYGLDDPEVEGVACHFTVPERGGLKGWIGVAEEVSDISLACRQIGPIRFKEKFQQGEDMFRRRRSLDRGKAAFEPGCEARGLCRFADPRGPRRVDEDTGRGAGDAGGPARLATART